MADEGDETLARGVLTEHARRALIHELGTVRVDAWLGKDGLHQHDVARPRRRRRRLPVAGARRP